MKKITKLLIALCLLIVLPFTNALPLLAAEPNVVIATFYVFKRTASKSYKSGNDPSFYTSLGSGSVQKPATNKTISDLNTINSNIVAVPDATKLSLAANEKLHWYRMVYNSSIGRWWVMGEIVVDDSIAPPQNDVKPIEPPVPNEPSPPETPNLPQSTANFYVLKKTTSGTNKSNNDPQYYTGVGAGMIVPPAGTKLTDVSAVNKNVTTQPNTTKLNLAADEEISWYRMYYNSNIKSWWVYGEIVKKENSDDAMQEKNLAANFYILNNGLSDIFTSSDNVKDYTLLGAGTINKPETELVNSSEGVLTAITKEPSLSSLSLSVTEMVNWYRIKFNEDKKEWLVFGQIVDNSPPALAPPPTNDTLPQPEPPPEKPTSLRQELYQWLINGDSSVHDISKYNLTYVQFNEIFSQMRDNEGFVAASCVYNFMPTTTMTNKIVKTVQLKCIDSDFKARYATTLSNINKVKSMMDKYMTEMDKMLLIHEYIVSNTIYKDDLKFSNIAGGPLGYGYAVCSGYARALSLLAREVGIDTFHVSAPKMNHAWVMAKIDNQWYHFDPTWADSRTPIKGEISHTFFARNDNEYVSAATNRHYSWNENIYNMPPVSKSTKYTKWFVHDVVGQMYYEKGAWYYVYQNNIVSSKYDGTYSQVIYTGMPGDKLKVDGIKNGNLTYTVNGQTINVIPDTKVPLSDYTQNKMPLYVRIISIPIICLLIFLLYVGKRKLGTSNA